MASVSTSEGPRSDVACSHAEGNRIRPTESRLHRPFVRTIFRPSLSPIATHANDWPIGSQIRFAAMPRLETRSVSRPTDERHENAGDRVLPVHHPVRLRPDTQLLSVVVPHWNRDASRFGELAQELVRDAL